MWLPPPQQLYPPWFIPQTQIEQESYIDYAGSRDLLNIPDLDQTDIKHITESRNMIPAKYRSRSEQLVNTQQFKDWLVLPKSRELLVHGDFTSGAPNYISALSLLCATLTQVLRTRDRYVSLVFFCGSHIEEDDGPTGGKAMIRSLIAQLLRQQSFATTLLSREVDLGRVKAGNLGALCTLFGWLVRRLPQDMTLICLIDGISHYENEDYEDDMLKVLRFILGLVRARDSALAVKILATSPSPTDSVQEEFKEDDDCFLSMAELPRTGPQFGMLNLESQLDDGSEDSEGSDEDEEED
jgi:hypothetical protein